LVVRRPAVAGQFYAGTEKALRSQIEWCFKHELGPGEVPEPADKPLENLLALVCPHAGYMYSGPVASHAYARLAREGRPDVVVILGPNHTGYGRPVAVSASKAWRTPLGDVEVDTELAEAIANKAEIAALDDEAHIFEHSIEVQLPFLQFLYGRAFRVVPICMMFQDLKTSTELGEAMASAVSETGLSTLLIASTDLTHYEPHDVAVRKDSEVVKAVEALDVSALYKAVEELPVSMCGYGPVAAVMVASLRLGAKKGELLKYATSGDITGDKRAVVGYASMAITR